MTASFDARYFDGHSTQGRTIRVFIRNGADAMQRHVILEGEDFSQTFPLKKTHFSERTRKGPRRLFFPDGSFAEALDATQFDTARQMAGTGFQDSIVVRIQQHWLLTIAGLFFLIGILFAGYQWGLPWTARQIAPHIPPEITRLIGEQSLKFLEQSRLVTPSKLSPERQAEITAAFSSAVQAAFPEGGYPPYHLEFRKSIIGANAFALPGNIILVTDDITRLIAENDDGLLGVMAHELGHLHYNHVMEQLISSSVIGTGTLLIFGDTSTLIATLSASALQANYSRQAETEADEYALHFMRRAHLPPAHLADMFRALEKVHKEEKQDQHTDTIADYFSTHPATPERIRFFEQG